MSMPCQLRRSQGQKGLHRFRNDRGRAVSQFQDASPVVVTDALGGHIRLTGDESDGPDDGPCDRSAGHISQAFAEFGGGKRRLQEVICSHIEASGCAISVLHQRGALALESEFRAVRAS